MMPNKAAISLGIQWKKVPRPKTIKSDLFVRQFGFGPPGVVRFFLRVHSMATGAIGYQRVEDHGTLTSPHGHALA